MTTALIIISIYGAGFYVAWFISAHYINRYKTSDSPLIGALLSWITVLFVIVAWLKRFF
jgi:hypothetical protein